MSSSEMCSGHLAACAPVSPRYSCGGIIGLSLRTRGWFQGQSDKLGGSREGVRLVITKCSINMKAEPDQMLLAFGARDPSPLTCLLSASTIHPQELVLSKKRRKKKSTKIMMAGLIPSKSQMPHSGSLPFQSQQVERGTLGRINMTKGSGPGSPCIFDYHSGT